MTIPRFVQKPDIVARLNEALRELYTHDRHLLEVDANERAITHRLAVYLEKLFPDWDVDCEYNRIGFDDSSKRLKDVRGVLRGEMARQRTARRSGGAKKQRLIADTEGRTVYPDIVVHIRGQKHNLLAIELKKSSNRIDDQVDKAKLGLYLNSDELGYRFGCFVRLPVGEGAQPLQLDASQVLGEAPPLP